jgi:hypothetical protein
LRESLAVLTGVLVLIDDRDLVEVVSRRPRCSAVVRP